MNGVLLAVNSIHVVNPPCTTARSAAASVMCRSGRYPRTWTPVRRGIDRGSIRGPVTTKNLSSGTFRRAIGTASSTRLSRGARHRNRRR